MLPEIGHLALVLALTLALLQAGVPLVGAAVGDARLMAVARPAAAGQFGFLALSFLCLVLSFVNNDFSVAYVAQNSNSQLPLYYRISAVWGGHEGSLLLWVLILSGWTVAVALFSRALPRDLVARVLGVMGLISTGFLLFLQLTSNPFDRLLPDFPLDGRDLNPLLQDFGLIVHPPMLYMGYVGFSVAFAFVVAALLSGRLDSAWARWSRPWTTVAWCFLTLGIALGSWWAYYELGWGGWWFWDPVENASFMPWLTGTALIHSLAATEKRGVFRAWTVLLAIAAFSLSLLGTFLVRSGVLTSVHAFATDPTRGLFILALLTLITGAALTLLVLRADAIRSEGQFSPVSRETTLLLNNVLLIGACGVVFTGTLFPLLVDVLQFGKISVGPPYFNTLFVPLTLALLLVLGVGPLLRWKRDDLTRLRKPLIRFALLSVALGVCLPWLLNGELRFWVALSLSLVFWVVFTECYDVRDRLAHKRQWRTALLNLPRSYKGMIFAHIGLAVCVTGVTITSVYSVERDVRMELNDTVQLGPYGFRLANLRDVDGPNYQATQAKIEVLDSGGHLETVLAPEKRLYTVQQMPMTEVAIRPGLTRDLYLALGEPLSEGVWAVRIHYKPFVRWIWLGAVLMAIGGFLAVSDPRYRLSRRRSTRPAKAETAHVAKA
ncbi:MAG: heme lyase CcmF/NrfE family subunit [Candidatus Competibacteraceae bacterium]|jgi:cytochrome c-type biogenesis protein CcmF|nr:heme lyase CcmF/NrfE family subunit [Candidatus Competibacteraceae bacterium]